MLIETKASGALMIGPPGGRDPLLKVQRVTLEMKGSCRQELEKTEVKNGD